jgi:hypothetical protein
VLDSHQAGFDLLAVKLQARLGSEQDAAAKALWLGQAVVNHADHPFQCFFTDFEGQEDQLIFSQRLIESDGQAVAIEVQNIDGQATELTFDAKLG